MNLHSVNLLPAIGYPLFVVAGLEALLGIILVRENPHRSPVNRSVAAFSVFCAAFAFITALMYVRASRGLDVTFLARANWISWLMIPAALQFIFYLRDEKSGAARLAGLVLYPFWCCVFLVSVSSGLIERGNYSLIPYIDRSGPLGKPLRAVGVLLLLWVVIEIFRLRRRLTGIKRAQLNFFTHGILIFAGGGILLAGVLQFFGGLGFEPGLASYFSLPWVALTFYAIRRHRLFDIRSVISRIISIGVLAAFFSLVQVALFKLLAPLMGAAPAITLSLFLIGFVFFGTSSFNRRVQAWVRLAILKNKFDYQQVLKDSIKAIATILDLQELLDYLVSSIRTSLQAGNVRLFLRGEGGQFVRQRSPGPDEKNGRDDEVLDGSVVEWIKRFGQVAIREELERRLPPEEFGFLNASMQKAGAEAFIPLFFKGTLRGVLALGAKGSREPYTQGDVDLLDALAGHAAVAIENARLYEEARRVQESLRESQERFRNLIETTSDWVWEMNDRGVYTYVSPKIRDILGYEPEEVVGKTFFDFMPREEARRAADFFVSLTRRRKPFMMYQNTNLHKSGRLVVIETSGVPVFGRDGSFAGYRGIDRDVTQRNELEGQLRYAQKMEAIGRLAGGIAHDFNNIMTAIVGYANVLHMKLKKDDPLRNDVDRILAATERAANLTQSLLAFGTKQAVRLSPVKLNDALRGMEKLLSGIIRSDIELQMKYSWEGEEITVTVDTAQLERVVMNLAANARDAMPGGGRLTIGTGGVDLDDGFISAHGYGKLGSYALIAVTDTGTGMNEETQKKMFEPFFTTKGVGKGTGFGLSIVYDIVKQHRGYINVKSAPGKGSTFNVYLPVTGRASVETAPAAPVPPGPCTVLVADNDDDDRAFARAALEGAGYSVVEAADGEEAVEQFRLHKDSIRFLVLDVIMPKLNGREAYRAIKRKQPAILALFTSGYGDDIIRQKGMLDEDMQFILKPFSSGDLIERIRALRRDGADGNPFHSLRSV